MDEVPTYRVVMHITCDSHPSKWLSDVVRDGLEDELEGVRLIECLPLHERPVSIEHHGGYQNIPTRY